MKQGKNPTVAQKAWLLEVGLEPKEWLIVKWTPTEAVIKHRSTEEVRHFDK